jgi:hypothetical protein
VAVAGLAIAALEASAAWTLFESGAIELLVPLAPAVWLAGTSTLLALVLRSWTAAGAALGGLWVAQHVLHGYFASRAWLQPWFLFQTSYDAASPAWPANRIELMVTGLAALGASWVYLRHVEWRFTGEEG